MCHRMIAVVAPHAHKLLGDDSAIIPLRVSVAVQKKKALRKKEEDEAVDLSFLEAEAASAAAASASAHHGSRAQRGAVAEAALEKREQDAAAKQARHAFPHLCSQSGHFTAVHSMQRICEAASARGGLFAVDIGQGHCMLLRIQRSGPEGRAVISQHCTACRRPVKLAALMAACLLWASVRGAEWYLGYGEEHLRAGCGSAGIRTRWRRRTTPRWR